jgi:hypothetical protein
VTKTNKTPRKLTARQKFAFMHRLMADKTLSFAAKTVAVSLLTIFHNMKTGRCNPSLVSIAETAGCSRRTAFSAIAELKNTGWITVESIGGGSSECSNRYSFDFERVQTSAPLTGVQDSSIGVQDSSKRVQTSAHEPLRTTAPPARGVCVEISRQRAPDGALEEKFERLCEIWRVKPDGIDLKAAFKAFEAVCMAHDGEEVIASAAQWVATTQPRFLKKLEVWLSNGAWRKEPAQRQGKQPRGGKPNPVDEMLNAGGVRRYA